MAQVASKLFAYAAAIADFNEGFVQLGKRLAMDYSRI